MSLRDIMYNSNLIGNEIWYINKISFWNNNYDIDPQYLGTEEVFWTNLFIWGFLNGDLFMINIFWNRPVDLIKMAINPCELQCFNHYETKAFINSKILLGTSFEVNHYKHLLKCVI